MLEYIISFFEFFLKLPKSTQNKIIDAVISTLTLAFRRFFKNRSNEDLNQATESAVTPHQWQGTTATVSSYVPSLYPKKKKEEFAKSIVDLVKSKEFIDQLSKRIDRVQTDDEEAYVALCSIETKKLIIEMMDNKK